MADESILEDIAAHIDRELDGAYRRMGCEAPRHNGKPMMQMVHEATRDLDGDELVIWMEAWRSMFALFFCEGPSPERVTKNIYSLAWCVAREHLANMTQTDLGNLFLETRAAWCERIALNYTGYLKKRGFRGTRVPGQKTESATQSYALLRKGNTSRAAGRRKGDPESKSKSKTKRRKP